MKCPGVYGIECARGRYERGLKPESVGLLQIKCIIFLFFQYCKVTEREGESSDSSALEFRYIVESLKICY
jgi:hypothetical protein